MLPGLAKDHHADQKFQSEAFFRRLSGENTMNQIDFGRRRAAIACAATLIAVSSLVAGCGNNGKEAPSTPSSSSAPASPTEKSLTPSGGNKFTPSVVAPPAPTVGPGNHHHGLEGMG